MPQPSPPGITPQQLAQMLPTISDDDLAKMPHWLLYAARQYVPLEQQARIAPFEHRAFARESVSQNPLMALPVAAGALAYQPYKAIMGARSDPSWDQVSQSFRGVYEGLRGAPPAPDPNQWRSTVPAPRTPQT